jgi:acyl-homoserine lactone acylase PvdQ
VLSVLLLAAQFARVYASGGPSMGGLEPATLSRTVTIYRDKYGVPHIDGPTDESVIFGFAYCQAEDYLWQIEESYVGGLGRASELNGEESYKADWNNRLFEIPRVACEDFEKLDPKSRGMCIAFTAGLNFYIEKHPESKLRLLERLNPGICWPSGEMFFCKPFTRLPQTAAARRSKIQMIPRHPFLPNRIQNQMTPI